MQQNNLTELYEQLAFRRALLRRLSDRDASVALKADIENREWLLAATLQVSCESVRLTDGPLISAASARI